MERPETLPTPARTDESGDNMSSSGPEQDEEPVTQPHQDNKLAEPQPSIVICDDMDQTADSRPKRGRHTDNGHTKEAAAHAEGKGQDQPFLEANQVTSHIHDVSMEEGDSRRDPRLTIEPESAHDSTPLPETALIPQAVEATSASLEIHREDATETQENTPPPCIHHENNTIAETLQLLKAATDRRSAPLIQEWIENTPEFQDAGSLMSFEESAQLREHLAGFRDTPGPEDEGSVEDMELDEYEVEDEPRERIVIPYKVVNRVVAAVRSGRSRPGSKTRKRKRSKSDSRRKSKLKWLKIKEDLEISTVMSLRELPGRDEFDLAGTQHLNRDNWVWGWKPPTPPLDTSNLRNLGVQMVDPMRNDDDGEFHFKGPGGVTTTIPRPPRYQPTKSVPPVPPKKPSRKRSSRARNTTGERPAEMHRDEEEQEDPPEVDTEALWEAKLVVRKATGMNSLPREILREILRELLISDEQVYVYERWSKVYRAVRHRRKFGIEPAILRVSTATYFEGIRVLYGENVFVYSLRDATGHTARPPADVEKMALDDEDDEDDDDDDGSSEYQADDQEDAVMDQDEMVRSRRRGVRKDWDGDIHIAKYFSLFRSVIIEAEHNRYGSETAQSMADAIRFWKNHPSPVSSTQALLPIEEAEHVQKKARQPLPMTTNGKTRSQSKQAGIVTQPAEAQKSNIHNLALRIYPSKKFTEAGAVSFTFVSFFAASSPVVASLQEMLPRFMSLDIDWRHLDAHSLPTSLKVDMRPLNIQRSVKLTGRDIWRSDRMMLQARRDGASRAEDALTKLADKLQQHCERKQAVEDGQEVMEFDWGDNVTLIGDEDAEFV